MFNFNTDEEGNSKSVNTIGREKSRNEYLPDARLKTSFELSEHSSDSNFNEFNTYSLLEKFQEMDEFKDWDIKVDQNHLRVWRAKNGSFLNPDLPFIH